MLNKLVGVPWDPTGVVRARADGGHHEAEHVIPGQIASEDGLLVTREQTPRSVYTTSDLIRRFGPTAGCPKCRSVARAIRLCRTHVLAGNASKDCRVVPTVWCHQRAMMSVPLPWSNVSRQMISRMNDPGEIHIPAAHSDQVVAASGQKRSSPEEPCKMDTDDTGGERDVLVAHVWLSLSRWSCSRTGRTRKNDATRDDLFADPELIIREEDWVNHKMDEGNFDHKWSCESSTKMRVYEIVKKEEFKRDPKAVKIGTMWLVTNKSKKIKSMIKARLVVKEFADDTKKGELFQERQGFLRCGT